MASTDSRYVPIKNAALRETFVIRDADGDLVAGATIDSGLASGANKALVSKDGAAFVNSTNNVTAIANGAYFLDLTAAEMNADTIAVIIRTTTVGAKDTPVVLYTEPRSIRDLAYPTVTGRSVDIATDGSVEVGSFVAGAITAAAFAAGAINAPAIATDAIDGDALAPSAILELAVAFLNAGLTEPAAVPPANPSAGQAIAWLYTLSRNKRTQTATTEVLRNDADNANIATSTKSDDAVTFIRGEWV